KALAALKAAARDGTNIMNPSIACAHAGVTTGEWGQALRDVFGEYRAPTGVGGAVSANTSQSLEKLQARVAAVAAAMGRRPKMLVGKPGLDGHSNGAEQVAVRARDAGFEVVYEGIRLTPEQIVGAALDEGVHVVGLSILSGSHVPLVTEVMKRMKEAGLTDVPVVVGGIIPSEDEETLKAAGVRQVYTPKDYDISAMMEEIVGIVEAAFQQAA
ncbi:MAG: cobalamin-dependent protein, partial [Rhodospirillales bacterium]